MGMHLAMTARDPRAAFLSDAAILASLRQAIASRVPHQEVDDVAQATLLEAWKAVDYPTEREGFRRWLSLKGRSNAIDLLRKKARRGRWIGKDDGEVDELPARRPEPANDARDALRFVQATLDERAGRAGTQTSVRWLLLRVRGESYASIAQAEGTEEATVAKSVGRIRKHLRTAWVAVAAVAAFFIVRMSFGPPPVVSHGNPAPDAFTLRERALRECDAGQWKTCLDDLDRVRELLPALADDPAVQRATREARSHVPASPQPVPVTP